MGNVEFVASTENNILKKNFATNESIFDGNSLVTPLPQCSPGNCVIRYDVEKNYYVHVAGTVTRYSPVKGFYRKDDEFALVHADGCDVLSCVDVTNDFEDEMAILMSTNNCTYSEFKEVLMSSKDAYIFRDSIMLDSGSYTVKPFSVINGMVFPCYLHLDYETENGIGGKRNFNVEGKNITGVLTVASGNILHPKVRITKNMDDKVENMSEYSITYYIQHYPAINSKH